MDSHDEHAASAERPIAVNDQKSVGRPFPGSTPNNRASAKGLMPPPESKAPRSLWSKIKHAFDYGNDGSTG